MFKWFSYWKDEYYDMKKKKKDDLLDINRMLYRELADKNTRIKELLSKKETKMSSNVTATGCNQKQYEFANASLSKTKPFEILRESDRFMLNKWCGATLNEAREKATELAKSFPGETFIVLAPVETFTVDLPVISKEWKEKEDNEPTV